jgi:hypothetical protein
MPEVMTLTLIKMDGFPCGDPPPYPAFEEFLRMTLLLV